MSRAIIIAAGALLAACANESHYNERLSAWVGRPLDDLVIEWGPPDKTAALSRGGKVVEYDRERIVTTGGYTRYEPVRTDNDTIWIPVEVPGGERHLHCSTRFVVSPQAVIESWSHDGNDCVARAPDARVGALTTGPGRLAACPGWCRV